jgi:hypothetical protein
MSVQSGRTTLEDVFISLTGHGLRDGPASAGTAETAAT